MGLLTPPKELARHLESLPYLSRRSRLALGHLSALSTLRLLNAYATQNYRAILDIATIYLGYTNNIATIDQQISFFITKALSLPSPYQRP